jgi:hypothetical protein
MSAEHAAIAATLAAVFDIMDSEIGRTLSYDQAGKSRLHSMLADGADQIVAHEALRRNWELVAPLPMGANLNCAINARPHSLADARAILSSAAPADADAAARAAAIRDLYVKARLFELGDQDEALQEAYLTTLAAPEDESARLQLNANVSARVALAARLIIEQSDIVLAVWDGEQTSFVGGTGHTIQAALAMGAPVIWIDPAAPASCRLLRAPEALSQPPETASVAQVEAQIRELVRDGLLAKAERSSKTGRRHGERQGLAALDASQWRPRSNALWHAYRRIEAVFGGDGKNPLRDLVQRYETPQTIARGAGAAVMAASRDAPGADAGFVARMSDLVLPRFAWADGISSYLSDTYRGGMMVNFALSALAIVGGISYMPFANVEAKWGFALFEFTLLSAILYITNLGQTRRWHGRWFETRRAAEYLRHAPFLLALGAARAPGRWPRGAETSWPEWYARHALREVGMPQLKVDARYLRHCLSALLDPHVTQQRDYHHGKAKRLTNVHHNLDRLSETLFQCAVASVTIFLALHAAVALGYFSAPELEPISKYFTFLGVTLPTFGGAIAGIRYFGDFERFAAISEVTAQKLDAVHARIALLLRAADAKLDYQAVAELAHAADDIVVSEIENWQAVFGGKQITVPV